MTVYYVGVCCRCGNQLSEDTGYFYVEIHQDGKVQGKAYCKNAEICQEFKRAEARRAGGKRATIRRNALVPS